MFFLKTNLHLINMKMNHAFDKYVYSDVNSGHSTGFENAIYISLRSHNQPDFILVTLALLLAFRLRRFCSSG